MLGFCISPRFVEHVTTPYHPERADRIRAIYSTLHAAGLIAHSPFPDYKLDLGPVRQAAFELLLLEPFVPDERWLLSVHTRRHVENVRHVCQIGGGTLDHQGDTPVMQKSFDTALLAVGGVLRCCDAVMRGECGRAFAAVRPPGHHAEPDRAMGFCLFSNTAIAARYLQQAYGIKKVAIVDFDVHHGNGTQAAVEADPDVLFISLHQHPLTCYPGSGYDYEQGVEQGLGSVLNIPLQPGTDADAYMDVFDKRVVPAIDAFRPEALLISAGFDAHHEDPLAQLKLTEETYELLTARLVALADAHAKGRVVSIMEGGYNLRATGRCLLRHLAALAQQS